MIHMIHPLTMDKRKILTQSRLLTTPSDAFKGFIYINNGIVSLLNIDNNYPENACFDSTLTNTQFIIVNKFLSNVTKTINPAYNFITNLLRLCKTFKNSPIFKMQLWQFP